MSASRPSRSPSPAQAPPVQQTPGPRAAALQKLYSDAVSHTLRTCSYSNFASSFPTPASHAPDAMKRLHTDFVEKLDRTCKLNFDQILRDRQVVASLNDLDRLVEDARKRKTAAEQAQDGQAAQPPLPYVFDCFVAGNNTYSLHSPHTLPASSLYLSHLGPLLSEKHDSLSSRLQTAQNENADLVDTVLQQRRDIERLVSQLETTIADIDAANGALHDMDALTEEAVALDMDLRTAG
ncbi:MIND kinetochore complex component Nnf1 [Aureobasidium pullulans]|uniref:MIND kinetochore complex component Nnf1 n=1 Tax=Aureobasidium pullulans TaxID=5580 RepID=A0A4V4JNA2_AURPU|nr:MIND kinetochore complex component Nnf1 [Aureobasidium pullulans]THZ36026.1 MIND kinetochore complex component Nnf1 [Aureobasidium pullulans]